METKLSKCWDCQQSFYQNELREVPEVVVIKKRVCSCCASGKQTMADIEANKRNAARAKAWNMGRGWCV